MIEKKFKIWDYKNKRWIHKTPIHLFGETIITGNILGYPDGPHIDSLEDIKHLVALQYIGKEDKNKVEEFEGDIVKFALKDRICKNPKCANERDIVGLYCSTCGTKAVEEDNIITAEIVLEKGGFCYRYKEDGHDHYWNVNVAESFILWTEVIGNRFDNAELIIK